MAPADAPQPLPSLPARPPAGPRGRRSDPFSGVSRLLVDGTNLLHFLARSVAAPGSRGRAPGAGGDDEGGRPALAPAALIGRLRAVVPPGVEVTLVFDGPPERGLGTSRLAAGLRVRFAGREAADRLIERLVAAEPAATLAITDDRALATTIRGLGGEALGAAWLASRLGRQRLAAPAPGRATPPGTPRHASQPASAPGDDRDAEAVRRRWEPGRGATRKRGNPKRGHDRPTE
ncbi:MAG TPA: NYN domain-containing protein [Candidatus Limnocylindrales bacterium]